MKKRTTNLDELIRLANPKEFGRTINEGAEQVKRYTAAVRGELPADETRAAWREFAQLFDRVARRGRLWDKDNTPTLALILSVIDAETTAFDRTFAATEACADDPARLRRIKSEFKHIPTIEVLNTIIKALDTPLLDSENGRRLAGFLSYEYQSGAGSNDARDLEAAAKLARVLADNGTPYETRKELGLAMLDFSNTTEVCVDHPALARRAFLLMCEARPKGRKARDHKRVLDLLAAIPDEKGGAE